VVLVLFPCVERVFPRFISREWLGWLRRARSERLFCFFVFFFFFDGRVVFGCFFGWFGVRVFGPISRFFSPLFLDEDDFLSSPPSRIAGRGGGFP